MRAVAAGRTPSSGAGSRAGLVFPPFNEAGEGPVPCPATRQVQPWG